MFVFQICNCSGVSCNKLVRSKTVFIITFTHLVLAHAYTHTYLGTYICMYITNHIKEKGEESSILFLLENRFVAGSFVASLLKSMSKHVFFNLNF